MHGTNPLCYVDGVGKEHGRVQARPFEGTGRTVKLRNLLCIQGNHTNMGKVGIPYSLASLGFLDGMTLKMIFKLESW